MGGSAFSRCAASSLSCSVFPASLLLYLFLPFWGLSPVCCIVSLQLRLPCIASPALFPSFFEGFSRCAAPPHLHRLTCTVSPALSPLHPPLSALSLLHLSPPFWGLSPFVHSSSLPGGVSCSLRPDSGAPSACAGTRGRKHSLPPANGRRPVVPPPPGRGGPVPCAGGWPMHPLPMSAGTKKERTSL